MKTHTRIKIKGENFGKINFKQSLRDQSNLYSPKISLISASGIASSDGLVHTGGNAKYDSPLYLLYPSQKYRILLILASLTQYVANELMEANIPMAIIAQRYLSFLSWVMEANKKV